MGNIGGKYTPEDLNRDLNTLADQQPLLQSSSYGPNVMELKGQGWVFNPKAPFDNSLLKGKMAPDYYTSCIHRVNEAHVQTLVGMSKSFSPSEIPIRRQRAKEAVEATLVTLNKEATGKGFRWDAQAGRPTKKLTDIKHGRFKETEHTQETSIILIFDD